MTSYTTRGYPYPDSNDPAANAPATVQELADVLETRLQIIESGFFTAVLTANSTHSEEVPLTKFPAGIQPLVAVISPVCPFGSEPDPQDVHCAVEDLSSTPGFIYFAVRATVAGAATFMWIAHG